MKQLGSFLLCTVACCLFVAPAWAQGFGGAVAVTDDDHVYIGAPDSRFTPGTVHIFQDTDEGWVETAALTAEDATANDQFGSAIALDGQTLLVGAAREDGVVYVFTRDLTRDDTGAWTQTATLTADDAAEDSGFGSSIVLRGDVAFIGAPTANNNAGAVYVFTRDDVSWTQQAKLTSSAGGEGRFGSTIAVDGDWALIAAPRENGNAGAIYAFQHDGTTWIEQGTLAGDGVKAGSFFGTALALKDGYALVGAPRHNRFSGAVFAFQYDEEAMAWNQKAIISAHNGVAIYESEEDTQPELIPLNQARQTVFGSSLALVGTTAWLGVPGAAGFDGAIYIAEMNEDGSFGGIDQLDFTDQELGRGAFFNGTLAVGEDVAVIGIPGADFNTGSALVYTRADEEGWAFAKKLIAEAQGLDPITGSKVDCTDGTAALFDCQQMDLVSFLPVKDLGGGRGVRVNDIWGWVDPETNKEYALVGRMDGTAFVDISNPANPVYLGNLARTEGAPASTWRDIKVYNNHAFIVADGAGQHGMQVFDLTRLRDVENAPVEFTVDAHYDGIHSAHNIVINEDTGFAYTVGNSAGGETCGGGSHIINIQDPLNPTFAGCFAHAETGRRGTGYTHDAQCVLYHGPDAEHQGQEICFGANETALSIADVTDKENTKVISMGTYPNVGYTHQGWLTDDHRYFYINDELDELQGKVEKTRTLIWDVSDLDDPVLVKEHFGTQESSDHNLYVKGNLMYQSNYQSGLRVLDISDPANPVEVAYFDTVPYGENTPGFGGSWSNYPYFPSGSIIVTSGNEGLFVLQKQEVDI